MLLLIIRFKYLVHFLHYLNIHIYIILYKIVIIFLLVSHFGT